jgi:hypothetical protein
MIYQMEQASSEPVLLKAANLRNTTIDRTEKDWESDTGRAVINKND